MLSLSLLSCAGTPPKIERQVKLYNGAPEVGGICRLKRSAIERMAKKKLLREESKQWVSHVVRQAFAPDEIECIGADKEEFKKFGCFSFSDIGVMLRYQENLLFSCEKWKP